MTREDINKCAQECADNNMVVPIDYPFYDDDYEEYKEAYVKTFKEGVEYADSHPQCPWISVKDDLPWKHEELMSAKYETKKVFVLKDSFGNPDIDYMIKENGKWRWFYYSSTKCWMPIPGPPKE